MVFFSDSVMPTDQDPYTTSIVFLTPIASPDFTGPPSCYLVLDPSLLVVRRASVKVPCTSLWGFRKIPSLELLLVALYILFRIAERTVE